MKAIVKATDEVVDVQPNETNYGDIFSWTESSWVKTKRTFKNNELITSDINIFDILDSKIDWERCRYELAKTAMQGLLANSNEVITTTNMKDLIKWSIEYADEMIRQLDTRKNISDNESKN